MYRVRVNMESSTQTFQMPESWFPYSDAEAWAHATPYKHFGSAWGEVAEDSYTFTLHVTTLGEWSVLITGIRNDQCGQMCATDSIEHQVDKPVSDNLGN